MSESLTFCIVVPMYNEEQNVEVCVESLLAQLNRSLIPGYLITVNDGSTDTTLAKLYELGRAYPEIIIVDREQNGGYGAALSSGVDEASRRGYDYALFMGADLTDNPEYIPQFVTKMQLGYDVIKASRYISGGGIDGVPFTRSFISIVGNFLARHLFRLPVSDCTNGFRAVKVDLLKKIPFSQSGFAVIMEELYHLKYYADSFADIPYVLTSRAPEQGKSKFSYKPKVLLTYLWYPVKAFAGVIPTPKGHCRK